MKHFGDGRDWFFGPRTGLFIHWGLYSITAWHEQEQMRRPVRRAEYAKRTACFNPRHFDPDVWIDLAREAGMSYLCFTAKHHDGFCLWDTEYTEYKVTHTPFGKDVLQILAEACRRRSFPLCLYYSVVDWHHPHYPHRNQSHELPGPEPGDRPDLAGYLAFLKEQVRELCTRYGPIHGIWWDMNQTGVQDPSIHTMIRKLQPDAVINNRGFGQGDYGTPERDWDTSVETARAFPKPTEACNSVGRESWGYRRDEDYFTNEYLIRAMDTVLAKGGNYLLNAGPDENGIIPPPAQRLLRGIGSWMKRVGESFRGIEPVSRLTENPKVLLTAKQNTLYVHLAQRPESDGIWLRPLAVRPQEAILLNDGTPVEFEVAHLPNSFKDHSPQLHLRNLPIDRFGDEVMIVKLKLAEHAILS